MARPSRRPPGGFDPLPATPPLADLIATPPFLTDPILFQTDLAELLLVRRQTLAWWRSKGRGPRFVRFGRWVVYPDAEVRAWWEDQGRAWWERRRSSGRSLPR